MEYGALFSVRTSLPSKKKATLPTVPLTSARIFSDELSVDRVIVDPFTKLRSTVSVEALTRESFEIVIAVVVEPDVGVVVELERRSRATQSRVCSVGGLPTDPPLFTDPTVPETRPPPVRGLNQCT